MFLNSIKICFLVSLGTVVVLLPLHVEVEGEEGVGVLVVEGGVVVEGVPRPLKRNLIKTWMPTNKRVYD